MNINKLFLEKLEWAGLACHSSLACAQPPALVLIKKNKEKVEYSWFEYKEKALQAMEGLKSRNLKAGQFVAIIALNLPESFFVMLGAIFMGAIPVPINMMLLKEAGQKELKNILDDCQPSLIVGNQCLKSLMPEDCISIEQIIAEGKVALAEKLVGKNINPEPRRIAVPLSKRKPEDLFIMPYTSGTTGSPKGVMLSEEGIFDRVAAVLDELRANHWERVPSYLPLGHIAELVATFFGQIYSGYTIYFTEHIEKRLTDPEGFFKAFPPFLRQVQPTIFLGVPKVWINFQNKIKKDLNKIPVISPIIAQLRKFRLGNNLIIRTVKIVLGFLDTRISITAAASKDQIDMEFFQNLDIAIDDIYGQTETGGPVLINGKPVGNIKVSIGEWSKEIIVEGQSIMLGYYNNMEATSKVIRELSLNNKTSRIYHTGDLGRKGATTQIFYDGRQDEGGKGGNGEYYSASKLFALEKEVKKIEGVEEIIFIFEGQPYLTALVFHKNNTAQITLKVFMEIQQCLDEIGKGLYKVKTFRILGKKELIFTPTMKVKKKAVIERFQKLIDQMYE